MLTCSYKNFHSPWYDFMESPCNIVAQQYPRQYLNILLVNPKVSKVTLKQPPHCKIGQVGLQFLVLVTNIVPSQFRVFFPPQTNQISLLMSNEITEALLVLQSFHSSIPKYKKFWLFQTLALAMHLDVNYVQMQSKINLSRKPKTSYNLKWST